MKYLSWFIAFFVSAVYGEIIETAHFSELVQYVDQDTLVILDIDDTLLIPSQTLGTDVWFCHRLAQLKTQGDYEFALDRALAEWEAIRHITPIQIVEEGSDKFIEQFQKDSITVMGLTTQGLALATRTVHQLQSLHIDLSKTAPSKEDHYFINPHGVLPQKHGVLYRHGVLFTSGTPKGEALFQLLDQIDYHPKRIVFINDKKTHLRDVEKTALEKGVDFVGLRYAYSDHRVATFRPEIADVQWHYSTLNHLLTDAEAEALLEDFSLIGEL